MTTTETESRVLPIPFDRPDNILALLRREKTETRRAMSPQPKSKEVAVIDPYNKDYRHFTAWTKGNKMILGEGNIKGTCHWRPPHGIPGDLLWVREALVQRGAGWYYKADGKPVYADPADKTEMVAWAHHKETSHCSSRYMPRFAARIQLRVTALRCERLWAVTDEGGKAEGVFFDGQWWRGGVHKIKGTLQCWPLPRAAFKALWESIHAHRAHAWITNPWVWVYTFTPAIMERVERGTA